jgi:adenylate kinase
VRVVFLGPPGAGKGTQAARLAGKHGVPHISTGDILRSAIARATPTGVEAKAIVDRGELVPLPIVLRLVRDRLREPDAAAGWLLDGFPRNLDQAHAFAELLDELDQTIDAVVHFRLDDAEVVRRLSGRRVCRKCGETFHLEFSPPPDPAVCKKGGDCEIVQRTDDREEAIRNRLRVYDAETDPLVGHYRSAGLLRTIDAALPIDEVERAIDRLVPVR